MVVYENECVGCPTELGCLGEACKNRNVPHCYCDICGDEVDILYDVAGKELCSNCALDELDTVDVGV